jgi:hypothetical protein
MKLITLWKDFVKKLTGTSSLPTTTPAERKYDIELYSGGTRVGQWISTSFARSEFGASFQEADTGDLIQISGTIIAKPHKEEKKPKIGVGNFPKNNPILGD